MRVGRLLLCSFAVLGLALATPTKEQCENCKSAFSKIALPGRGSKDKVERQIATLLRSDKLSDDEVNVFKGLPGKDTESMVTMISEGSTAEDVCRDLMGCGVDAAQQGGDSDNEKGSSAHAGTSEVLDSVALAELAAEASSDEGAGGNNSTKGNSTMFTGGFAWDKHDFDVANNKGGDVKVEINLAAPDTPDSPFVPPAEPEEELSEIVPLLQEMISQKEEVNPIQLMEMMKDMMLSLRPPEPEQINVTEIIQAVRDEMAPPPQQDMSVLLKGIADVIRESPGDTITHETKVVYPPAPPQADAASIISSFGTTMSAIEAAKAASAPMGGTPQQPFNVPEFMHEMKEMVEANKAPPAPPAGADQGLVDLVKETMEELKQMRRPEDHTTVVNPPMPTGDFTGPPPAPVLPTGEPSTHPNSPFPTAPQGPGEEMPDSVKEYIQQAIAQARPALMPELPKFDEQKKQVEELKELLRTHAVDVQRPIVLPPPAPQPVQSIPPPQIMLPPPPPPSALAPGHDEAKIAKMVADLMPSPQRIPAPPTISVAVPPTKDCCSDPPEGDDRPEEVRCPRINGIKRPKCKRNLTPPGMKKDALTTEMRCTDGKCDEEGEEEENANSVANPHWQKMEVPEGMPANFFNPAKLMKVLCPGGICPEQKDLEPKLTQWPKMRTHKAMAEGL